ncbi:unnamed protein product [Rotaria socialis]|uniref:Uncharacterized protein n=1 Tax=Rotaria socialis TaxID=392032 RepID=A0A821CCB7_9BILA|nr:unnamed protein product [Rotaria socialis]CAF4604666.1 unnamed protein product [Rotaria socialis]
MASTGNEVSASNLVQEVEFEEKTQETDILMEPPLMEYYSPAQKILSKCMSNLNQDIKSKIHQQLSTYNQLQLGRWIILNLIYVGLFSIFFAAVYVLDV